MIDVSETIYQNRMTQASLGRLLNKGRAHIWRWANNKSALSALNEERLRKALKENGLVIVEKKS